MHFDRSLLQIQSHAYMHSCTLSLKYLFEKCSILSITTHIYKNTSLLLYLLVNMAERKELTEFERGVIVGGWLFGHSEREIEEKTGHPKTTVHRTIEKYRETGTTDPLPRSGRPPVLTSRDKRHCRGKCHGRAE